MDAPPDDTSGSWLALDEPITQGRFAALVGCSVQAINQRVAEGQLVRGESCRTWLLAYVAALRDAASRFTTPEARELVVQRTELARSQREAQDLKNAVARGEYAPIGLLEDVLATASAAVADRLDGVEPLLRRVAPDMPQAAHDALLRTLRAARAEWVRSTMRLAMERLDQLDAEAELEVPAGDTAGDRAP